MRAAAGAQGIGWRRWLPLAGLLAAMALAYALGFHRYLGLEALRHHREELRGLVAGHPLSAALGFTLAYAAAVALSLPGAVFLTLAGGFLFGTAAGAALSVIGATAGAILLFLIARTALGEGLRSRAGPWLRRIEEGLREHALSYLIALRLIPVVPFWLVNLAPAFTGVALRTYAIATFIGIIPGAIVFAGAGSGLGSVLEHGGEPGPGLILEPRILLPLLGLALLALLPVAYRRWQAARRALRPRPSGPS